MAVAKEQEMQLTPRKCRPKSSKHRRKFLGLGSGLRDGTLGVMDYYNMKNIMADTEMRSAVAQAGIPKAKPAPAKDEGHKGGFTSEAEE